MHALVTKNAGNIYTVLADDGTTMQVTVKGNFRIKGIKSTSPVVIGDQVEVVDGMITAVADRKNYIVRKSINLSKQSHILAANLDQCFLIVTVSHPVTSTTFIDRFLATAEAYNIPAVLVFNKTDIYDSSDMEYLDGMVNLYETIGYKCLKVSAATGEGMDKVSDLLNGKVTLVSGHSGVGKSTFINRILPDLNLRTADISDAHDQGMHTTTFSEMYPIDAHGFIIDTPGIKGFGSFDMEKEDIGDYFREIFRYSQDCRFNNCTHTHEPGCAVLEALERHDISQSRYNSYLSMLEEDDKYRG
ncbi:MAG: ribosome small subunit-dependent GTPase A [Bacteroidaceae bacterium]|nr:ribosome small subunit-dependent GTPase A [Bacteroidaceae bacterium]